MNRIYKVIYSKARQCYIVVSELAKSNHKSSQQGADHTNTPALARIIALALTVGALTWGCTPGISWAADNTAGSGNGVAIGTGSDAPKNENVAIGKGAGISYSNGASTATGDIVVGSGANINNYASQGGSIAIGKNATVENMTGKQESLFALGQAQYHSGNAWGTLQIPDKPENVAGSIAIGDHTYARTGSIMIGSHNYRGQIGDRTVDTSKTEDNAKTKGYVKTKDYGININATTLGTNSFNQGAFSSVTGAYSIISGKYNGSGFSSYGVQNFGATITGSLNSIESATSSSIYSGIANSIVGTANRTFNSNGSLIFGAGNTINNSVTDITNAKDDFWGNDVLDLSNTKSAKNLQDELMTTVHNNKSGGATLIIGGGNVADYTQKTQILGVNNTVTGTKSNISDYNMIDGFGNTITGASHLYTIGTNNKISNTKNTILAGDDYTNVSGLTDSVIIGNNRVKGDEKAEFAYFNNQKNIVSIGNKNVLDSTDGSISIGNNNFMWRSGGQPEKYGYDTGNVAIGNNTYINSYLNQGDSIVIGKNATVINMGGSLEKAFAFGTPEGKDYSGSIAIGQNSYARSGSTMIGIHNYQGKLGDLDIDFTKDKSGGHSGIGEYQESIDATTIGNNSYNNGVFSTVVGSYTAVSGLYHNQKWGEKPYGVQNFGAAVLGSLNSVEGLTSTEHNTAGMADSILGSANRTKNANGTIMVGAGNVVEDSINDFDASEIKTKDGIASPNALSEAMRTSIKNANGGGAAAIVGNGNEVKKSTNVAVMGSKNTVTSTTNSQIFGDNRAVTGADGAPIDGAVIIGSAAAESPLTTDKKNVTILGYNANATVEGGVALGSGSVASGDKDVVGYDSANVDHSKDTTGVWKSKAAAVSVGDKNLTRQITNVAAGKEDTDAVNVAQLKNLQTTLNGDVAKAATEVKGDKNIKATPLTVDGHTLYTLGLADTVTIGSDNAKTVKIDGTTGEVSGLSNITWDKDTDYSKSTKAATEAQLQKAMKDVQTAAESKDTDTHVKAGTYAVTTVKDAAGKDTQGVALDVVNKAGTSVGKVTITDVAKASDVGDVSKLATGSNTVVDAINNVNTKVDTVDKKVDTVDKKVGDLQYGAEGQTNVVKNGDSVTKAIGDLDKAIGNASTEAGKHTIVSTKDRNLTVENVAKKGEAANYQLALNKDITVDSVTAKTVTSDTVKTKNLSVSESASIGDVTINKGNQGTIDGLKNTAWDAKNITSGRAATEDQVKAATKNAVNYDDDTSKTITLREDTTIKNVANTAIEQGSKNAVNAGTVYNETRVKQDGKYVKASNTAGENLSVLDNQVASNSSNITNLNGRVNNLDSKVNKVGAGAAALAALHPLDFDPEDKWDFAVGYGNYRDANSVAVGAFYRPDDDTMFSVGTNFGNGENMINAGVSFKFGPKGKSQVRPGSTQEITELRATVARQDDQLKKQDNEIKELKAMVQQLMAKQDKQATTK